MSKSTKALVIIIVILIALASVGCEDMNESAETVLEAGETVAEVGSVHSVLKSLADSDYAQPLTR